MRAALALVASLAGVASLAAESPDAIVRRVLHVEQVELAQADLNGMDGRS